MPLTLDGNGTISGLGDIDGHDLETNTLVNVSDATFAAQAVGRATLFIDESTNTVGINTTTPAAAVFLEVADGTDPIVSLNNTANGEVRLGCNAAGGYIGTESNHPFNIQINSAPAVTVLTNGNVGVGTVAPTALLHLESNGTDAAKLRIGFDAPRYYDIFRGSISNSGLLNFYGSQTGFVGYVFDGVDGEYARINTNGRVGIGVSSPAEKLDIGPEAVGGGFKLAGQSVAVTSNGLTIDYQPNIGSPAVDRVRYFAEPRSSGDGVSEHRFYAYTGGTRQESGIFTGNGLAFSNGKGIDFSASEGSGASSSLLDDYEEGTWTPSIGGTATYTTQQGTYTKIGNLVRVTFYIVISNAGSGSNQARILGLPFQSAARTGGGGLAYWANLSRNIGYISAYTYSSSHLDFYSNDQFDNDLVFQSVFTTGSAVQACITYQAA